MWSIKATSESVSTAETIRGGGAKRNLVCVTVVASPKQASNTGPQPSGDVSMHPGGSFLRPNGSTSSAYYSP